MRESGGARKASSHFSRLQQMAQNSISLSLSFWRSIPSDIGAYWIISNSFSKTGYMWDEVIVDNPNSTLFLDGYVSFLLDAKADFIKSVEKVQKKRLIEAGHSFVVDHSVRSLVFNFPFYLKRKIIDQRGSFIKDQLDSHSGESSNNISEMYYGISENQVGKSLFSQPIIRLAFQRAMSNKKSNFSHLLKIWAFINLLTGSGVTLCIVLFNSDTFDGMYHVILEQTNSFEWRIDLDLALFALVYQSIYHHQPDHGKKRYHTIEVSGDVEDIFQLGNESLLISEAFSYLLKSQKTFQSLVEQFIQDSFNYENVYKTASFYLEHSLEYHYCANESNVITLKNTTFPVTLNGLGSIFLFFVKQLFAIEPLDRFRSTQFCSVIHTFPKLKNAIIAYSDRVIDFQTYLSVNNSKRGLVQIILIPIAVFLVCFIPYLLFYLLYIKEIKTALLLSSKVEKAVQVEAGKPISSSFQGAVHESINEIKGSHTKRFIFTIVMIFISSVICPVCMALTLTQILSTSNLFVSMSGWLIYGSAINSYLAEAIIHILVALFNPSPSTPYSFINSAEQFGFAQQYSDRMRFLLDKLQKGDERMVPISGQNQQYDQLVTQVRCDPADSDDPHMIYSCLGLHQKYEYALTYIESIIYNKGGYVDDDGLTYYDLANPQIHNLIHIFNCHIFGDSFVELNILRDIGNEQSKTFQSVLIVCLIVDIFASFVSFFVMIYVPSVYDRAYETALFLFRRLPPSYIVLDHELENFLLRTEAFRTSKMDFSQSCIHFDPNPILILNKNQIIESLNQRIIDMVGYFPGQLIGHRGTFFLSPKDKDIISETLFQSKVNLSDEQIEKDVVCLTDSNQEVFCHLTIAIIKHENEIFSYVLFFREVSEIIKKKSVAKEKHAFSEKIINEIFPSPIVKMIATKESTIGFSVSHAAIMFIDIVKFNNFCMVLPPSEVLDVLANIYSECATISKSYDYITQLKIYGGTYVCAAGMFSDDSNSQLYSEQIIRFAQHCLYVIQNASSSLSVNISVRIGIHSGGPILAGLVESVFPMFEVFGEIVSIAYKLQRTGAPGKIHISQHIYDDIIQIPDYPIHTLKKDHHVKIDKKNSIQSYLISYQEPSDVARQPNRNQQFPRSPILSEHSNFSWNNLLTNAENHDSILIES